MRVIAGENRGANLKAPKGDRTRPTTDRVKESLFAIITPYVADARVLDLFAGSGALAIEALSRGARQAVLVDRDPVACTCIRENLKHTRQEDQGTLLSISVNRALQVLNKQDNMFDLVFLDPPYDKGLLLPTLIQLADLHILAENGLIVAEHRYKEEIGDAVENFVRVRQEVYGDTVLTFLRTGDQG